jgi:hypothetical protein
VGAPQEQITVPICRSTTPSDSVLYDAPQGKVVYWLPRWRVIVPAGGFPQIEIVQQAAAWTMTVHLEPYPADAIKDQISGAVPLPATYEVAIRYNLPGPAGSGSGPVLSIVSATTVSHDGTNLVVEFQGTDGGALDRLYGAMTSLDRGTNLAITQVITVAVQAPRFEPLSVATPEMLMTPELRSVSTAAPISRPILAPPVFRPIPEPLPGPLPDPGPLPPLFRVTTAAIDDDEQFYYPADRYPSIYQGITFGTPVFTRTRREVMFGGVPYPYYQEAGQSATFYYLPDEFKLARALTAPHLPALTAAFSNTDQAEEMISCQLGFVALPTVQADRLAAARTALTAFAPGPYPPGITGPDLQPLAIDSGALSLKLAVPRTQAVPAPGETGDTHLVSLRSGIIDSETMALADFRTAFAALFGGVATLTGQVQVVLSPTLAETVTLSVRVNDTTGPVLEVIAAPSDEVTAKVTLINATESSVSFGSLSLTMWRGPDEASATPVTATATQLQSPLPVSLDPGGSWSFVAVAASTPVPGVGALTVTVNTPDLAMTADPAKVWDAVFATSSVPASYQKPVTVRIPTDIFAANTAHPSLKSVTVSFQSGDAVSLDSGTAASMAAGSPLWTSQVKLPVPVRDYVVPTVDPGTYRYRVRALTADDTIYEDADWRSDNTDILDVSLPPFVEQTEDIVSQLGEVDPGASGPQVRRVQALLRAADAHLTDNDLAIDGDFGPITENAVKAFQQANGLSVSGMVGAETWHKLLGL